MEILKQKIRNLTLMRSKSSVWGHVVLDFYFTRVSAAVYDQ